MHGSLTVSPAYGRDYTSKATAIADWNAGKDFTLEGLQGSGYVNLEDARHEGVREVRIRYKRLTQVVIVKVESDVLVKGSEVEGGAS